MLQIQNAHAQTHSSSIGSSTYCAANHGAVKLCHLKVKLQYSEAMPSDVVLKRGNDQVEVESSVVTTEILRRTFRVSVRVTVCVRALFPKGLGTRLRVCMIKVWYCHCEQRKQR